MEDRISADALFLGSPVRVGKTDLLIPGVTIGRLKKMEGGLSTAFQYYHIISLTKGAIIDLNPENYLLKELLDEKNDFQALVSYISLDVSFQTFHKEALKFFCGCDDVLYDTEQWKVYFGFKEKEKIIEVTDSEYNELLYIIGSHLHQKQQELNIEEFNPQTETARKFFEKVKQNREKVAKLKAKANKSESFDFTDILLSICSDLRLSGSGIDDYTVWAVYELYEQERRKETYITGVQRLLAGDKEENVKLQHWIGRKK